METKQIITSLIIGLIAGLIGTLTFEPFEGFIDVIFSDYTIGGIVLGIIIGLIKAKSSSPGIFILNSILIGAVVFLLFGLISGKLIDDLIAGVLIGLFVALASHFLASRIRTSIV